MDCRSLKGIVVYLRDGGVRLLERFDLDTENWVRNVESYGGLFYRIAGQLESILVRARQKGQHWLRGRSGSEQLYRARGKAA